MSENEGKRMPSKDKAFPRGIGSAEDRKIRHRGNSARKTWIGFAYFGLIGWSVVVPILAGTALGLWLDGRGGSHGWTLSLLLLGAALGCWGAWRLIEREGRKINGAKNGIP